MKRLLAASALGATILIGLGLAYALWSSTPVTAEEFMESGMEYFEQEQYSEATVQFLNAIQRQVGHRDARFYLASSYLRQGNMAGAAQELNALLEYYPEDNEAGLELGNIYLANGAGNPDLFSQALQIAEGMLERESENVAALILSGNASAGLQDYLVSVEQFEKAVSIDPENAGAFISLGSSQAVQTNYEEAEAAFLRAREIDPENQGALMSLGNYYRAVGQLEQAEETFEEAFALYPGDAPVYLQLVEFYYLSGRFPEVERVLQTAQEQTEEDPAPSLVLVDLYPSQNRQSDAQELLFDLKTRFPENLDVAARLAVQLLQDDPDLAQVEIDRILEAQPENPIGHILLGELQYISGDIDAAATTFANSNAADSPFPQPSFFLGQIANNQGRFEDAVVEYRRSLTLNPRISACADWSGRIPAERRQNRGFTDRDQRDSGRSTKFCASTPDAGGPGAKRRQRWRTFEDDLNALVEEQPDNPLVYRQLGFSHESLGRAADAEQSFRRAFELQPDTLQALQDLTMFYVRTGLTDRAIEAINAVPDDEKQADHYDLLGLVYLQAGQFEESENAYNTALAEDPDRTVSRVNLAGQYIQNGRLDDALDQLDELIRIDPSFSTAYDTKGVIYESQGNLDEARESYSRALELDPNNVVSANNLAYLLAEEGQDLQAALRWAQLARGNEPDNANAADTLGWVYYRLGNYVLGRDQLQYAVSEEPDNGTFQFHLGRIYMETGQVAEARSALERALNSDDFDDKDLVQAALDELSNQQ